MSKLFLFAETSQGINYLSWNAWESMISQTQEILIICALSIICHIDFETHSSISLYFGGDHLRFLWESSWNLVLPWTIVMPVTVVELVLFALESNFSLCNYNKNPKFGELNPGSLFSAIWKRKLWLELVGILNVFNICCFIFSDKLQAQMGKIVFVCLKV